MHRFISNENMLLVQKLIDAIKEGEDGVGTVRWLLEDSGHKFSHF